MGVGDQRVILIIVYECLRDLGRFEEALGMHQQACAAPAYAQPAAERRSQAVLALGLTWLKAEMGDGSGAWEALQRAVVELAREDKLNLWCEATAAWVYALFGQEEQARQKIVQADAGAARFAQDRATLLGTFSSLGRAAYVLEDFRLSQSLWGRYLALEPDIVSKPKGLYFLGNCALRLGQPDAAREMLQQAVSLGVGTYYARLAGEQLRAEFPGAQ